MRLSSFFFAVMLVAATSRGVASTLYGSTSAGGGGELWILDSATGTGTQDVGPLNDSGGHNYAVTGLAFHPTTGVLYGSTGGTSGKSLLTINPTNGLVTVVGPFNYGGTMSDIAFDSSGHLYGISAVGGANLYSIDITTGNATQVGPSGIPINSGTSGGGLAISPDGIFYSTPIIPDFGTFDPATGAFTDINNPSKPAGEGVTSYAALAFDGATLYGLNLGTPPHLVTLDAGGNVTDLGTTPLKIDGIAFQPAAVALPPSPTLTIKPATGSIAIGWISSATFRLQQNSNLTATSWIPNTNSVNSAGGTNQVSVPKSDRNMFFRLIYP